MNLSLRCFLVACVSLFLAMPAWATTGSERDADDASRLQKYRSLYLQAICQREIYNKAAFYRLLERALEVYPEGHEAMSELATFALNYDTPVPVQTYLERAHELQPDNLDYTFDLARYYLSQSDSNGVTLMRQLLKEETMRDYAYASLCEYYDETGQYDSACAVLDQWRPIKDDDAFITSQKMAMAREAERHDDILLYADTLERYGPEYAAVALFTKGYSLISLGRIDEAMEVVNELEQIDSPEATLRRDVLKANVAMEKKDTTLMRHAFYSLLTNVTAPAASRMVAYSSLMDMYQQEGVSAPVAFDSLLTRMLPLQEEDKELYENIASEIQKTEVGDSLRILLYNKILDIDPSDEYARLYLMEFALNRNDYDELNRLSVDGLKENAKHPLFYFYSGSAKLIKEDYEGALELFASGQKFINERTHTELVSMYYTSYGDALYKLNRKAEAYAMYDSALVYNNDNTMCLNNYAYFLSLDNIQLDKALQMSAKTLKRRPDEPVFLDTYAWILFLQGNYAEAREYMLKAIEHLEDPEDPDNVTLYEHTGDICYHLGFTREALQYWQHAQRLDPNSALLKKKIKDKKYYKE